MSHLNAAEPAPILSLQTPVHWHSQPITTTQLVQYAGASGDFNPLHFDHHFALQAGQQGVIAHGMLTMGLMAVALEYGLLPTDQVRHLSARFLHPVRPGDEVHVYVQVQRIETAESASVLHCVLTASVGESAVASGQAVIERV